MRDMRTECGTVNSPDFSVVPPRFAVSSLPGQFEKKRLERKNMDSAITLVFSIIVPVVLAYATTKAASYSKDVVGERQKWRSRMRKLTIDAVPMIQQRETQNQSYQDIVSEFRVSLNPDDPNDREIIETLESCKVFPSDLKSEKLLIMVSRLLKHDWERAKQETSWSLSCKPNEQEIRRLRSEDYLY